MNNVKVQLKIKNIFQRLERYMKNNRIKNKVF